MYEVSALDHLNAKVDALFQIFDKLTISVVTPAPVLPPCEVCGIFGHTGVECQLGSTVESPEQLNYAQCNLGMRPNQNFYNKTSQNPFGQQTTPPAFANNQRVPQKSSLELLLENYVMGQSKQLQELNNQTGYLNDSLVKLTSKVDFIATHNKMLETQISQVAQQVATSSQTPGVFPSQTETNPNGHINVITLRDGKKLEDVVVKTKTIEGEIESDKPQIEKVIGENEKPIVSPPHKPKIRFPQRLAKRNLEAQFKKFVDTLKKIYTNIPFTESLSQMPLYAKNLKDILSKKRTIEDNETTTLTKECSVVIKKLPPKLLGPGSFSIPCVIGNETIEKAMCDLVASVSLLPLSLFKRMGIGELRPTEMTLQLADRSTIHPVRFIEDIPVKVRGIYILDDFVVVDIDEDPQIPILLGRPFLATKGAIIDVKIGRIVFHVSDERVELEIANFMKGPAVYSCCMIDDHSVKERFLASSAQYDLFDPF